MRNPGFIHRASCLQVRKRKEQKPNEKSFSFDSSARVSLKRTSTQGGFFNVLSSNDLMFFP